MDKAKVLNKKTPGSPPVMPQPSATVEEANYLPILIAVFVIFITLVLFIIYKRKKSSRRGILITGLCDSGKTLLYTRLVHDRFVLTQTSIKENIDEYAINGKSVKIVDIPGHERLRGQFLDLHKSTTRGLIYVIDSQNVQKDIKDVAEFFYNILTDPVIYSNSPAILILCNKQDQPLVKNSKAIKTLLEKELNTLKLTKSSQLESLDANAKSANVLLGEEDEAFTFAAMSQYKIDFADAYATNDDKECNIVDVEKWLAQIV